MSEVVGKCLTCGEPYGNRRTCQECWRCPDCCACPEWARVKAIAERIDACFQEPPDLIPDRVGAHVLAAEQKLPDRLCITVQELMRPEAGDIWSEAAPLETGLHRVRFPLGTERIKRNGETWYVLPDPHGPVVFEPKNGNPAAQISLTNVRRLRLEIYEVPGGGAVWVPVDRPGDPLEPARARACPPP